MLDGNHFIVVAVTVLTVMMAAVVHYEAFIRLSGWLERSGRHGRQRILMMVFALIFVHVLEIGLFALAGWGLVEHLDGTGHIIAPYPMEILDYMYFSAVSFTTLGYGEMYPHGAIRFLFSTEALTGFALITWSASLTFIEMQRHWRTM